MSASFHFGLERVRELREHAETEAKERLAATLSQRLRGASLLARAAQELQQAASSTPAQEGEAVSGADLVAHALWLQALEQDRDVAEAHLGRLDEQVAGRRQELGEASREREVLERLKQRRREEHRTEAQRRESNELDEIATGAHVRRGRGRA